MDTLYSSLLLSALSLSAHRLADIRPEPRSLDILGRRIPIKLLLIPCQTISKTLCSFNQFYVSITIHLFSISWGFRFRDSLLSSASFCYGEHSSILISKVDFNGICRGTSRLQSWSHPPLSRLPLLSTLSSPLLSHARLMLACFSRTLLTEAGSPL